MAGALSARSARNPHLTSSQRRAVSCSAVRRSGLNCTCEKKEYYDYKDMPPLPLTVSRIHIPKLSYTVVDKASEEMRLASLAIFYDVYKDDQYNGRLTRKSAITALCMFDQDDVREAQSKPGNFPNIDLLFRVYNQGLDLDIVVEEFIPK